ncbi:hypothetical protein ACFQ9X_05525 [Catenulispora yoronensis]
MGQARADSGLPGVRLHSAPPGYAAAAVLIAAHATLAGAGLGGRRRRCSGTPA